MQETLRQGDPLDKEMATHSSILAWKIPHSLIFCSFYKVMIMVDNQEESIKKENDCYLCMCVCCHVRLFATPWTIACQAPLPM